MLNQTLRRMMFINSGLLLSCMLGCSGSDQPVGVVAPTLLGVTPDKAAATGGTQVVITGSGFLPGVEVEFAGVPASTVNGQGSQLTATVPAYNGPLGPAPILIHNPDGGEVTRSDLFSYVRIPIAFAPTDTRKVGAQPSAIVAEDVNGDGGPELVVVNQGDNTMSVLLHNQNYQSAGLAYETAPSPVGLVLADINGDGQKDALIACDNASGQDLSVLRGSGNGTFLAPVNLSIALATVAVAAQDYNGDGKIDVAVVSRASGLAYVLTNNSPGASVSFATPYATYTAGLEPVALLGYDLSGKGSAALTFADYRGNQVGALTGPPTGAFQMPPKVAFVGNGPLALAAGNLTADHYPDVVTANFDASSVSVLTGQGDGTFSALLTLQTALRPSAVAVADMDQDGQQDVIVANSGTDQISIFLGNGDGSFEPAQQFAVGQQPWALAVADLDGDGKPDVATANLASGDVSILYNRTSH